MQTAYTDQTHKWAWEEYNITTHAHTRHTQMHTETQIHNIHTYFDQCSKVVDYGEQSSNNCSVKCYWDTRSP